MSVSAIEGPRGTADEPVGPGDLQRRIDTHALYINVGAAERSSVPYEGYFLTIARKAKGRTQRLDKS